MDKRLRALPLILAALLLAQAALGEHWDASHEIRCAANLPGCRLLQTVMMGSFDALDPSDALSLRVLSSALPKLCEVTEADLSHFSEEFGEAEDAARERWYGALADCLRADIRSENLPEARMDAARRVLLLFLEPDGQPDAEAQMEAIRSGMTDEVLRRIAQRVEAPEGFVRWLIFGGAREREED